MSPFNNDWCNSIFISQDQVALESVCYDFLRTEWNGTYKHNPANNAYEDIPNVNGVDDYLHQAADQANWPEGIIYDPDNSGKPLASLGVHEHWNNPVDKQYTRNLGTGSGIELVWVKNNTTGFIAASQSGPGSYALAQNYPNPFNPSTRIRYVLADRNPVTLSIVDVTGRTVATLVDRTQDAGEHTIEWYPRGFPSGMYFCRLVAGNYSDTKKMILQK